MFQSLSLFLSHVFVSRNAYGMAKADDTGRTIDSVPFFKLAVEASAKAVVAVSNSNYVGAGAGAGASIDTSFTQVDLDVFEFYCFNRILKTFEPANLAEYGERFRMVCATDAGQSRPLMGYSAMVNLEWFPALIGGDQQHYSNVCWRILVVSGQRLCLCLHPRVLLVTVSPFL